MIDKRLATLLLVAFIDLVGFGIVIPILPTLITDIGGDALLVGVVISLFSLFQFLFSPILGRLSDKYGRRPVLMFSAAINSVAYFLLFFVWQNIWIILLARIIAGIGSANLSVAQAYIADTSKAHDRTKKLGLFGSVFSLGFIVGPLLGGLTAGQFGIAAPFLIPAVLSLINTILIYFILPESNLNLQKHVKIEFLNIRVVKEAMRPKNISFLLFLFFFVNFALALIIGVFPLYSADRYGWNELQNGYYFALIGTGAFISQAILLRFMLKFLSETKILRLALFVFGIAVVAVGLSPFALLTYIIGPFTSFGFSLVNVNTQALISLESTENEQGAILGVAQSFAALARAIGPLVGGVIATINLGLPYFVAGLVALLVLLFGNNYLRFMKSKKQL